MGSGIAEVAAKSGFKVTVREMNSDLLEAGQKRIRRSMDRAVEKEKLTPEERDAAWECLTFATA
ncbi:MAG TPA: 3-hydroxybutyryl-CoA dehydrogenase, partial [Gemmatimonadetes bacterium]|nr:3-hydroxybutyryl-CoA dehydrogenase [Gemmatimonadota bacterium]